MRAQLRPPDFEWWESQYPAGVGRSVFSSPSWQRLMLAEEERGWELRFLLAGSGPTRLSLPVLARRNRRGRWLVGTRPVAYFVPPIEKPLFGGEELEILLRALSWSATAWLGIWLPPWSPARPRSHYRGLGHLDVSREETYVIRMDEGAARHIQQRTSRTRRRKLLLNERNGLELVTNPSLEMRDAYYDLYRRVYAERDWVGRPFSRAFFEGVATQLDRGGELCLVSQGERVVGGGILLYDQYAVHYFQGVTDRSLRDISPHDAVYLHALQSAESRQLPYVNLGGINLGNTGLARFKSSWGATAERFWTLKWRSGPRTLASRWLGFSPQTRQSDPV